MDNGANDAHGRIALVATWLGEDKGWRVVIEEEAERIVSVRFFPDDAEMFRFVGHVMAATSDPQEFCHDR
jgi:hypothetical protein